MRVPVRRTSAAWRLWHLHRQLRFDGFQRAKAFVQIQQEACKSTPGLGEEATHIKTHPQTSVGQEIGSIPPMSTEQAHTLCTPRSPGPINQRMDMIHFSSFDVTDQVFLCSNDVAAIVNLKPVVPGHVLVIPRIPYKRLADMPPHAVGALFETVQKVGRVVEYAFNGDSLSIAVQDGASAGQTVSHVHVHVLPRRPRDIEPSDLVYDMLDKFGLELRDIHTGKQMDSERKPRTKTQMREEASWLKMQCDHVLGSEGDENDSHGKSTLPVTLLSGFLGSGKTTLLRHILMSPEHGLRIAVIINDMGELNIDAQLIANGQLIRGKDHLVELSNGCICCTLRADLLEHVALLARDKRIDYLLIESSGISEPMQVAETFSAEFAATVVEDERLAAIFQRGGLPAIAHLDTCCTVVDAASMLHDFDTSDFLVDRHGPTVPEDDDRNISDLMVDQLEFANCVIVNKCDLVSPDALETVMALVKTLNPSARVIPASYGRVDVNAILSTKSFSLEKAALSAGWLRSLVEDVKPETIEYGINSFVYRARRPFHPARLWETIRSCFVVIQEETMDDGVEQNRDDTEMSSNDDMNEDAQPALCPQQRLACKRASPLWNPVLRSKGFLWLATRPLLFGNWSQAGVMLTLTGGARWRCEVPENEWPDDPEVHAAIRRDFDPLTPWGDRRQELVFIGQDVDISKITKAMDSCLLRDDEWRQWEKIMHNKAMSMDEKHDALADLFEDGFEDWVDEEMVVEEHDQDHDHDHDTPKRL